MWPSWNQCGLLHWAAVPNLAPLGGLTAKIPSWYVKEAGREGYLKRAFEQLPTQDFASYYQTIYLSRSLLSAVADLTKFSPEISDTTVDIGRDLIPIFPFCKKEVGMNREGVLPIPYTCQYSDIWFRNAQAGKEKTPRRGDSLLLPETMAFWYPRWIALK